MHDDVKLLVATKYAEYVKGCVRKQKLICDEIDDLYNNLLPSGIELREKIMSSTSGDAIPNGYIKLQEMIDRYHIEMAECRDVVLEFHACVQKIKEPHRDALLRHYAGLHPWEKVCRITCYSKPHMMRIRREGLIMLYDVMPEEHRCVLPKAI